jgi:hypothetical protein
MRIHYAILTALLGLVAVTSIGVAAPRGFGWRGSGGWAAGGPYARLFDPKTVVSVRGTIITMEETTPLKGMGMGVHLMLKTNTETIDVHLGPLWYVEAQDADLKVGDAVEVRGSRIESSQKPAIIAIEVKRGDDVLALRDEDGIPRWAGWRRGGPPRPWK